MSERHCGSGLLLIGLACGFLGAGGCSQPPKRVEITNPGNTAIATASGHALSDGSGSLAKPSPALLGGTGTGYTETLPEAYFRPPALEESKAGLRGLAAELLLQVELEEAGKTGSIASGGEVQP